MVDTLSTSRADFEAELRFSPRPVLAILIFLGLTIVFLSPARPGFYQQAAFLLLGLAVQATALVAWGLIGARFFMSRWLTVALTVVIIFLSHSWLIVPGLLTLLVIPTALAAALMGLRQAVVTAIAETLLLLLLWLGPGDAPTGLSLSSLVMALVAVWAMVWVMVAVYHPVYQITNWAWDHYQQAQTLLEEARDRKAELEQALDDLMRANRQLDLLNEKLTVMRHIAEEAQKTKAAFVAKVSHEFRTPLNMIIGLADLLLETPEVYGQELPPPLLEDLNIVYRNCEHLSGMINDVLDLSQVGTGQLSLQREWVDLTEDVKNAVTVVQPLMEKKQVSLRLEMAGDLPQIYCDRTRIRQVVLNLLSNAARFTEKGSITLQVARQEQALLVSVKDTGPGISPEDAERVFEPFYQSTRNPWQDQDGSGLGLSISKQFVELHGGRIWLESEPGLGSTFSFKVPITPPAEPVSRPSRWLNEDWVWTERPTRPAAPRFPYRRRVVVCDDAGDLYHSFTHYSDEIEFIHTADIGQTARELQKVPAHAVMINSLSPNRLWPLVERAREEIPDTPIIGGAFAPQMAQALAAGATGYLVKPITRARLVEALRLVARPVKRVLIVDDNPDVQQLLSRMLAVYDQTLTVVIASNARQALDQLRRSPPDLVLLDLVMPGLDGWQFLALKNQNRALKDIPAIIISAQDPAEQPVTSEVIVGAMGRGLSMNKFTDCSLKLAELLLKPD